MKIKKVVDICRREGVARIYEGTKDTQWLSCGFACYPLYGVPALSEDEFFTIFDFTEKQREETIFERSAFPSHLSTSDFLPSDQLCEKLSPNIPFSTKLLIPFSTASGIKFLDSEYLAPFAGEINNIEVYERISKNGENYFVVKIGMCLKAIIMPFNAVNESFVDNIEKIYALCKNALYKKEVEEVCQIGAFDGEDEE